MTEENSNIKNLYSAKAIARNTFINIVGFALPLLLGIAIIPTLIKGMGVDRFGVLTLAWMVIGYFSLFDLGLGRALTQIIAIRLGRENEIELSGIVWTALIVMLIMGFIGAGISGLLTPFLVNNIFKMPDNLRPESLQSFYILSASIPIIILSSGFVGILSAHQRFDLINAVRIPLGSSNFIVPLLVLYFSTSIAHITFFLALSRLASCVALYWLCLRAMPMIRGKKRFFSEAIKPLLSFGGWMTVSNIIGPLMVYLDRFIIGAVISVTAVAYYATPFEIVTKLWIFSVALVATLFPTFAATKSNNSDFTIKVIKKSFAAIFILIFPIVLTIVTFSKEGLTFWLGKDFAKYSAPVMQWLATGVFINSLAQVIFALVQGRGRPDITAKIHLFELIFYFPILWWSIKQYGIVGAAVIWTMRATIDGILLLWASQSLIPLPTQYILKLMSCVIMAFFFLVLCGFNDSLTVRSILFCISSLLFTTISFFYLRRNGIFNMISPKGFINEVTTHKM